MRVRFTGLGTMLLAARLFAVGCGPTSVDHRADEDPGTADTGELPIPDADSTPPINGCGTRICGPAEDGGTCGTCAAGSFCSSAGECRAGRLEWAGVQWYVRSGGGGPGPNRWDARNVSVDAAGNLHLQIVKRDGIWTTAEVTATQRFGFGRYQWFVEGALDHLDPNVVLGLFTYPTAAVGPDGSNEIDVELARWGNAAYDPLNYTIYPATAGTVASSHHVPMQLNGTYTTHRFDWSSTGVDFGSYHGFQDGTLYPLATWSFAPSSPQTSVPQTPVPTHLNLWLFQGNPPADDAGVEIIIHDFRHP